MVKETPKKQDDALKKAFKRWTADKTYFMDYDTAEVKPGFALIRIYQFTPNEISKAAGKLTDTAGVPLLAKTYRRIIPYAMVIDCNNNEHAPFEDLAPGDIVTIADHMASNTINPEWRHWQEAMKERPAPEIEYTPQKYVNKLSEWGKYLFVGDKLKASPTEADALTFMIPQQLLASRYKKSQV